MKRNLWKVVFALLLTVDVAIAEEAIVNISPMSIVGEWVYDLYRSRLQSIEVSGREVDEEIKSKLSEAIKYAQNADGIPKMTITETEIINHGNAYNKERITPYRVIGGNSGMVTVEVGRGPWKHVIHIHVDDKGIYFAPPDCGTYPDQCQQMKTEYFGRFGLRVNSDGHVESNPSNATATNTTVAVDSGSLNADEMWEQQLKERHYFVPAPVAGN